MIGFEDLRRILDGIEKQELERWIDERWVLPESGSEGYVFHEIDVARVRLIVELKHDLAIGEEAMPVLLNLLDQLYALRRRLKAVADAIGALPEESRLALQASLNDDKETE
jgi:chaperone modulatory protein CbpM